MTPDGWTTRPLLDLCDRITDGSHFSPTPVENGVPIATVANMRSRDLDVEGCARISENDFEGLERNGCRPKAGDVLFSKDGSVGKVLVMQADPRLVLLSSIAILRPNQGRLASSFLGQSLRWSRNLRILHGMRTGTAIKRVVLRDLRRLRLAVPPLYEQHKIAAILSSMDEAIETTRAVVEQLRVVKLGLMQELLSRGIPNRHQRLKQTSIGEVPEEWNLVSLSDLAEIRRGASPRPIRDKKWFSDDGPGWVRIADVTRSDRFLRSTEQALSRLGESKSVSVRPGDLIMSICATIGKPIVLGINACIHDGFVVFRKLGSQVRRDYLYYQLQAREQQFVNKGQPGTQKNLNTTIVGRTRVPLPSTDEQDAISRILWAADDRIAASNRCLEGLQATKKALMSVLLTGELRVTPDPEDE